MVVALLVLGALLAHTAAISYVRSHTAVSSAVLAGLVVLVLIKHLGLLGPLYVWLRKRSRR